MTPARAALPLALVACALACEGKRAVAPVAVEPAEHVDVVGPPTRSHLRRTMRRPSLVSGESAETGESGDAAAGGGDDGSLVGEERESDPRSDTVKIKVIVDARRQAHVVWGRKDFGVAPLEIERPRNSGPLDLIVVAPGYLRCTRARSPTATTCSACVSTRQPRRRSCWDTARMQCPRRRTDRQRHRFRHKTRGKMHTRAGLPPRAMASQATKKIRRPTEVRKNSSNKGRN